MNFFKSSSIFLITIFLLILTGAAIFINHQGLALKILILVFWIMPLGAIVYILESKK